MTFWTHKARVSNTEMAESTHQPKTRQMGADLFSQEIDFSSLAIRSATETNLQACRDQSSWMNTSGLLESFNSRKGGMRWWVAVRARSIE